MANIVALKEVLKEMSDWDLVQEIMDRLEELAGRKERKIDRDGVALLLFGDACRYWYEGEGRLIRRMIKDTGNPPEGFKIINQKMNRQWIVHPEEALKFINENMFPFTPPVKFTPSEVKMAGVEAGWEEKEVEKAMGNFLEGGKDVATLRKITGKHAKTGGMFGQVNRIKEWTSGKDQKWKQGEGG